MNKTQTQAPTQAPAAPAVEAAVVTPEKKPEIQRQRNGAVLARAMQTGAADAGDRGSGGARAQAMRRLQRSVGNARAIQAKLEVNTPGDVYEQEADRVAEKVTQKPHQPNQSTPISRIQHSAEIATVKRRSLEATEKGEANSVDDVGMQARILSPSGGRPLPMGMRQDMESSLGTDLSSVRVHDGSVDRADADHLNAKAFTHGSDIWIGSAGSAHDRKLMVHELTHVVQQTGGIRRQPVSDFEQQTTSVSQTAPESVVPTTGYVSRQQPSIETVPATDRPLKPQPSMENTSAITQLPQQLAPNIPATDQRSQPQQPSESAALAPVSSGGQDVQTLQSGPRGSLDSADGEMAVMAPVPGFLSNSIEAAADSEPEAARESNPESVASSQKEMMPDTASSSAESVTEQKEVNPSSVVDQRMTPDVPLATGVGTLPHSPSSNLIQRSEDDDGLLGSIRRRISGVVDGLHSGWSHLTGIAQSALDGVRGLASGLLSGLQAAVAGVMAGVQAGWSAVSQMVMQISEGLKRQLTSMFGGVTGALAAMGQAIMNLDGNALRAAWGALIGLLGGVWQGAQGAVRGAMSRIAGLWNSLSGRITTLMSGLVSRAREAIGRMQSLAETAGQRLASAWETLRSQASGLSGVLGGILDRLRSLVNSLLSWAQGIWESIRRGWSTLEQQFSGLVQGLRQRLTSVWTGLQAQAAAAWVRVRGVWSRLQTWAGQQAQRLLVGLRNIWNRIQQFSIGGLVDKITKFGVFFRAVEIAVKDPDTVMRPLVDGIAGKVQAEMPAKAIMTGTERLQEATGAQTESTRTSATPTTMVQRQPTTPIPTPITQGSVPVERTTASGYDIWKGFVANIKHKWAQIHIWQMVKDMLWSLVWPWPAIGEELSQLWNNDLTNAVRSLFKPRSLFRDPLGFFHDLWTDILHLLDIPLAILRRLNNILLLLMGWITLALVIIGAIGGTFAGAVIGGILAALASLGIATGAGGAAGGAAGGFAGAGAGFGAAMAIGQALFIAFLLLQGTTLAKTLATLLTGRQTADEKQRDYGVLADSLIGLGVALVLAMVGWLASKLATFILDALARIPALRGPIEQLRAGLRSTRGASPPENQQANSQGTRHGAASEAHVRSHGHAADGQPPSLDANATRRAGTPVYKSKFAFGEGGQAFTDEVMTRGTRTPQSNGRIKYEVSDLGRITGTGQNLQPVRGGTVIVEGPNPHPRSLTPPNEVVTQFPSGLSAAPTSPRVVPILPPVIDDQDEEE